MRNRRRDSPIHPKIPRFDNYSHRWKSDLFGEKNKKSDICRLIRIVGGLKRYS